MNFELADVMITITSILQILTSAEYTCSVDIIWDSGHEI